MARCCLCMSCESVFLRRGKYIKTWVFCLWVGNNVEGKTKRKIQEHRINSLYKMETVNFSSAGSRQRADDKNISSHFHFLVLIMQSYGRWQDMNWNLIISLMEIKIANKYSFVVELRVGILATCETSITIKHCINNTKEHSMPGKCQRRDSPAQ